jgi:hypothetical protein
LETTGVNAGSVPVHEAGIDVPAPVPFGSAPDSTVNVI